MRVIRRQVYVTLCTLFFCKLSLGANLSGAPQRLNDSDFNSISSNNNCHNNYYSAHERPSSCARSGFRISSSQRAYYYQNSYERNLLSTDLQEIAGEHDYLNYLELYAFEEFRAHARTLPCYERFIDLLSEKIKNDKNFREKTAFIRGFHYSFSFRKEKSGFHDFVHEENNRIAAQRHKQAQEQEQLRQQRLLRQEQEALRNKKGTLSVDNHVLLDEIINDCSTRMQSCGSSYALEKLQHRVQAVENTKKHNGKCFDYSSQVLPANVHDLYVKEFSNTYGTYLDLQLHKELCDSRQALMLLEQQFNYNHHAQFIAPLIHCCAAQAKQEANPVAAFNLADFCYAATEILAYGMNILSDTTYAVGKGVVQGTVKGIQNLASLEHWYGMITGPFELVGMCMDICRPVCELHSRTEIAVILGDLVMLEQAHKDYCVKMQEYEYIFDQSCQEVKKKLAALSWQELVQGGTEIGATIIIDSLALHSASVLARSGASSFINHATKIAESGALLSTEYAVEVAGIGKLIIEEGAPAVSNAAEVLKGDFILNAKAHKPLAQQIKNAISGSKISQKAVVEADSAASELSKKIVNKIRNVGDDILDVMEKAGGHTLEKHVAKTHSKLLSRSVNFDGNTISTFVNKRIAVQCVKKNLRENAESIALWLSTNPLENAKKTFDSIHLHDIGKSVLKGKKNGLNELKRSKIVLIADSKNAFGFTILTAYPIY